MPIGIQNEAGMGVSDSGQDQASLDSIPLVTVALPVYNAGKYLRPAVFSIINQTFKNWELLVIDDGSTDSAIQKLAGINDARIKIFRDDKNLGLAVRLNEAINMAKGSYFARMDSDDISYPERFARQLEKLHSDPTLDLIATRAITIDGDDNATGLFPFAISHEEICARPWRGFYLPHPTWMGRIEWFRKHRYEVPAPFFCEDQELLLRTHLTSRFGTLDEILLGYRVKNGVDWNKLAETRRAIFDFQIRFFSSKQDWQSLWRAAILCAIKLMRDLLVKSVGCQSSDLKWEAIETSEKRKWDQIRIELAAENNK